jgi:hypothetical protein
MRARFQKDRVGWIMRLTGFSRPIMGGSMATKLMSVSVFPPTTVRVVLDATVTWSACESYVLQARLAYLPSTLDTVLLDAGYDDGDLIEAAAQRNLSVLAPLSKGLVSLRLRPVVPVPSILRHRLARRDTRSEEPVWNLSLELSRTSLPLTLSSK